MATESTISPGLCYSECCRHKLQVIYREQRGYTHKEGERKMALRTKMAALWWLHTASYTR